MVLGGCSSSVCQYQNIMQATSCWSNQTRTHSRKGWGENKQKKKRGKKKKKPTGKRYPRVKHQSPNPELAKRPQRPLGDCGTWRIVLACGWKDFCPSILCDAIWKLIHQLLWHGKTLFFPFFQTVCGIIYKYYNKLPKLNKNSCLFTKTNGIVF